MKVYESPLDGDRGSDIQWLAGLLEGEGCFALVAPPSPKHNPYGIIQLSMTDRDVVERAAACMGGKVRAVGVRSTWQHKQQYSTAASGFRARRAMEFVLPYLGKRRAKKVSELLALPHWGWPLIRRGKPA